MQGGWGLREKGGNHLNLVLLFFLGNWLFKFHDNQNLEILLIWSSEIMLSFRSSWFGAMFTGPPAHAWQVIQGALALGLGWTIGANDAANALGAAFGAGVLSVRRGVLIASVGALPSLERAESAALEKKTPPFSRRSPVFCEFLFPGKAVIVLYYSFSTKLVVRVLVETNFGASKTLYLKASQSLKYCLD